MSALPADTNLADPELIPSQNGSPFALFAKWREEDPVHWNPPNPEYGTHLPGASLSQGFWVLTRYEDVFEVSRGQTRFTSHDGSPVIWDFEPPQLAMQQAGFMGMKPEQHAQVKRLVMPPFAPRELAAMAPEVDEVAKEIVDGIASKGSAEFVFDVASKLPVYTFCKLVGIKDEMRDHVAVLGNKIADIEGRSIDDKDDNSAMFQLFAIAQQLAEEKRQNPDKYMMSRLVNGSVDGARLDEMQINMFFIVLAIAGHETTRNTAGHFIRLMGEHPDQFELLMSDLDRYLPGAIDEVLRYSPPVVKFRRTVTEDTEIGGQPVKKGDKIYLSYPAANRDPSVFEDPDRFDITRGNASKHLAFGTGPHVCIGARLATMQLRALLTEIYTRIPDIRIDGEMEWLRSIWFSGVMKMPVSFTPEKSA